MTTFAAGQISIKILGYSQVSGPERESPKWRVTFGFSSELPSGWERIFSRLTNGLVEKQSTDDEEADPRNAWTIRFSRNEENVLEAYCPSEDIEKISFELRQLTKRANEEHARFVEQQAADQVYANSVQARIEQFKHTFNAE